MGSGTVRYGPGQDSDGANSSGGAERQTELRRILDVRVRSLCVGMDGGRRREESELHHSF